MNFSVDLIHFRLSLECGFDEEEMLAMLLENDPSFKSIHYFTMWKHLWDSILYFLEHLNFMLALPAFQELVLLCSSSRAQFGLEENSSPAVEYPLTLQEVPSIYLNSNTMEESQALRGEVDAEPLCETFLQFLVGE